MRMKRIVLALIIYTGWVMATVAVERESIFDTDCNAWVSAVGSARSRPPLRLSIEELMWAKYAPPDLARVRELAENLYKHDDSIKDDFPTMEDYVSWNIEYNSKQSREDAKHYQYSIDISSNRFRVVSKAPMQRGGDSYNIMSGVKVGRQYSVIAVKYEAAVIVTSSWFGSISEYTEIFEYGCISKRDHAALGVVWKLVRGNSGETLWEAICAAGGELAISASGLEIKVTNAVADSVSEIIISSGTTNGVGVESYVLDRMDGRLLKKREYRNREGIERVSCKDFVFVNGGAVFYPRKIVIEKTDLAGSPIMTRELVVRTIELLSDEDIQDTSQ